MDGLKGRIAIVTGARKGIGCKIASCLVKEGAHVVLVSRTICENDDVVSQVRESGQKALVLKADITDGTACREIVHESLNYFGRIDILVNNAGIYPSASLIDITREEWDNVFAVNLKAPMFLTQCVVKSAMIPQKAGRIVNISSIDGSLPTPGIAHYAASKAGLESLTKSMAIELAPYHITANAVAPGWVDTENIRKSNRWKKIVANIPLQRLGSTEEIAKAVAFLVSDNADYITGACLNVNGGLLMI